jgi:hypothetical protein
MALANKKQTTKGKPHRFPKGVSGNPAGRPKTRQSWGEIAKEIGDQYPEEVVTLFGVNTVMGRAFATFPKGVQIKYSVFYRVIIALMNEPTPGLLKELLDRIEGKVTSPVDVTSKGEKITDTKEIYDSVIAKLGLTDEATETPEDTNPTPE